MAHPGIELMMERLEETTERLRRILKNEMRVQLVGKPLQRIVDELIDLAGKVEEDIVDCEGKLGFQIGEDGPIEWSSCKSKSIPTKVYCPIHEGINQIAEELKG